MKVIFLDFDGVLNRANKTNGWFEPECIEVLNDILEKTGAKIVVTSSWRLGHDTKDILKKWGVEKVDERWIGVTPTIPGDDGLVRGQEIRLWQIANGPHKFAIIDDWPEVVLTPDLFLINHFFLTDSQVGLTKEIGQRIINHLADDEQIIPIKNNFCIRATKVGTDLTYYVSGQPYGSKAEPFLFWAKTEFLCEEEAIDYAATLQSLNEYNVKKGYEEPYTFKAVEMVIHEK